MQVQCLQVTPNHSFEPQTKTLTISPHLPHFTLQNQPVSIKKPIVIHQIQNMTYLDLNSEVSVVLHTVHIQQLIEILKQFKIVSIKIPKQETQLKVQSFPISQGGTILSGTFGFQHDCFAGIENGRVWVRDFIGELLIEKTTDSVYFNQELNSIVFGECMFFIWKRLFGPYQFNISLNDPKAMKSNLNFSEHIELLIEMDGKMGMEDEYGQTEKNLEIKHAEEIIDVINFSEGQNRSEKHEKMEEESSLSLNNSELIQSTPTKPIKQIQVEESSMEDSIKISDDHCNVNENDENCSSKYNLSLNESDKKTQKKIKAIMTDSEKIPTVKKIFEMEMELDIIPTKLSLGSMTEVQEKTQIKEINYLQPVFNESNKILARCPMGSHYIDVRVNDSQTYLHLHKFENGLTKSQKLTQLCGKGSESAYPIEPTVLLYSPVISSIFLNDPFAYNLFTYNVITNKIHQLPTILPVIHICHQSDSTILGIHSNEVFIFDIREQSKHRLERYKTVRNLEKICANGNNYVTRDFDGVVRTYDIRSNKKGLNRFDLEMPKSPSNLQISSNGNYILSGNELIKCINESNCSIFSSTVPHEERNEVKNISIFSLSHAQFIDGLLDHQIIGVSDRVKKQRTKGKYLVNINLDMEKEKRIEIQDGHIDYLESGKQWTVYSSEGNYYRHETADLL